MCVHSPCLRRVWFAVWALFAVPAAGLAQDAALVESSASVLTEIMNAPASSIPQALLAGAQGLVIVPNMIKGGLVVGIRHGKGVALTRDERGAWRAPVFLTMTGGSVGWQAGVQASDVVLVFKTPKSVQNLLSGKFTIGADAAAAAGPVGRQAAAATDAQLGAEILSYSRSRGLFVGVSVDGSALQIDQAATNAYYQSAAVPGAPGAVPAVPPSAVKLVELVTRYTTVQPAAAPVPGTMPNAPGVPPGSLAAPNPVPGLMPNGPQEEAALRQQLAGAAQQLQPLLDENWRRFLALPAEVYAGTNPPTAQVLTEAVRRFETVAADPRYAALVQRPEFQNTLGALRKYQQARAATPAGQLALPPPPAFQAGPVPGAAPQG